METIQINELMYDRGRGPELRSCRITVYDLVPYWLSGKWTDEEIIKDALPITMDELLALKKYFEENQNAVLAWHEKIEERNRVGREVQNTPASQERSKQFRAFVKGFNEWSRTHSESQNGQLLHQTGSRIEAYRKWLSHLESAVEVNQ